MNTEDIHKYTWKFEQKNLSISNQYRVEFLSKKSISYVVAELILRIEKDNKIFREYSKLKPIYYKRAFHLSLYVDEKLIFNTNDLPDNLKISKLTFSEKLEDIRNFGKAILKLCNYFLISSDVEITIDKKNESDALIEEYLRSDDNFKENNLTNLKAALICNGLENASARKLANKYFSNSISDSELSELFNWAEKTIAQYGVEKIDQLIALPKLTFCFHSLNELYKLKSNDKSKNIEFMLDGDVFSLVSNSSEFKIVDSLNKVVGNINKTKFETNPEYKISKPKLLHFLHFVNDPINFISYYGYQTGNCGFCHSKLTDPISCKWGYGKKCAENYNLDWN